jgi:hypothetical protein
MKAEAQGDSRPANEDQSSYEPGEDQVFGFPRLLEIGIKGRIKGDYFGVDVPPPDSWSICFHNLFSFGVPSWPRTSTFPPLSL